MSSPNGQSNTTNASGGDATAGAPTSAWAGGPPASLRPAGAAQATPERAVGGLAGGANVDATPGGSVRISARAGGGAAAVDLSALKALIDESISQAVGAATAPLHQELGALKQRFADAESRASTDGDDDDDDDDEESVSVIGAILGDQRTYLTIDPKSNRHFGAADVAHGGDFKPKRHDLYGHKPWMVLTKDGNDTGGILGLALSYAEPLALFGKAAVDATDHLSEVFAAGIDDPEAFLEDMVALRNTVRELYGLTNLFRSIVVQKSRALRPGATEYDKAEVKFLERALHERDFSTADTASEIATLRAMFAKRSTKSDLERLAKKGSGGGGGGGADLAADSGSESGSDASDKRRKRNKKKREKAKERKRHAKDGESNGRSVGGSREARRDGDGSGGGGGGSSSRSAPSSSGGKRRDAGGGGKSSKPKGKRAATPRHGSGSDDDEAGFE